MLFQLANKYPVSTREQKDTECNQSETKQCKSLGLYIANDNIIADSLVNLPTVQHLVRVLCTVPLLIYGHSKTALLSNKGPVITLQKEINCHPTPVTQLK